jgi:hypothetical protein
LRIQTKIAPINLDVWNKLKEVIINEQSDTNLDPSVKQLHKHIQRNKDKKENPNFYSFSSDTPILFTQFGPK